MVTRAATRNLIHLLKSYASAAEVIATEIARDGRRKDFAESFCASVLDRIWQAQVATRKPRWPMPDPRVSQTLLDSETRRLSTETASAAIRLDAPTLGYFVGTLYTSLLPSALRTKWGVYYTPPPIAERLICDVTDSGLKWDRARVIDPACGGAAFLAPLALHVWRILARKNVKKAAILDHISSMLSGVEVDPFAAWMSQVLTELRLARLMIDAGRRLALIVRTGDAFEVLARESGRYDLVIGNPPYGKVPLPPALKRDFGRSVYGHANLYGLFTDLSLRISSPQGFVAFVTPTSFLSGQYFKALRRLLSTEAPPVVLDFVHQRDGVFEDVLQETALVVFRKGSLASYTTRINTIDAEKANGSLKVEWVSRHAISDLGEHPWLLPRNGRQCRILRAAVKLKHRLAHYGLVVSTGQLVWNRHKDQLREKKTARSLPLIWAESVLPEGAFRFRSLRRNHKPFIEIRGDQEFLVTRAPCVLVQRTTAKEQNRRLVAAVLPQQFLSENGGSVVVENHLNIIRPSNGLMRTPSLKAISLLLNSLIVDELFRCISGSVAVSAYELNALPLPDPDRLQRLEAFAMRGSPDSEAVEKVIADLYGVE